jgi:HAE1 family hydrophobic/amphiphilic exporter-1
LTLILYQLLLGKNAILIVEFASMKHSQGSSVFSAAVEGATLRLRPILMTSLAFIAGLIPLMISSGAGKIGNNTIGSAAAGGMLFGTFFGLILTPGLYVLFAKIEEKIKRREPKPLTENI